MRISFVLPTIVALTACNKKAEQLPAPPPPPPEAPKIVETPKPVAEAPAVDPKLVERGRYVANASGCVVCHTAIGPNGPDVEHAFAGGLEMPDTIGTWRTPNITQDKRTGIGGWTDAQIIAAVREGMRPDGERMFAIMPYANYNRMTDDDAKALVAFLRTIKPIERLVARNKDLKLPPVDAPKPANLPDLATDRVKHGEYLASLMLCSHCHWTPLPKTMTPAGPDKLFSGGMPLQLPMATGTLYSPNITSDPETGIGKWTEDQIFGVIKSMQKPDGKVVRGPMVLLQSTWSQLDDDDLRAVAVYVKQLPAVRNKVPESTYKLKAAPQVPPSPHDFGIRPKKLDPENPGQPVKIEKQEKR
jgi:mono/diheme cytochrome c family protein